jgi:hypothetical protein
MLGQSLIFPAIVAEGNLSQACKDPGSRGGLFEQNAQKGEEAENSARNDGF